jgi:hypothetical protein
MKPWTCRLFAFLSGAAGAALIALVLRALYARDHAAQTLMFDMGVPLVLLATMLGGLLLRGAAKFMGVASHAGARKP